MMRRVVDPVKQTTDIVRQAAQGLSLPLCWQILDMAEYWPQIRTTEPLRPVAHGVPRHFKSALCRPRGSALLIACGSRKVVFAIGGRNMCACKYYGLTASSCITPVFKVSCQL